MKRKKLVILPRLNDANGNIKKSWFVFYSFRNPKTDKLERFRIYEGFKKISTAAKRYAHADKIIKEYTNKIKAGWSPFGDDDIIYDDLTLYSNIAKVYGTKRKSNNTIHKYINDFLKETKARVSPKSFESYQSKVRIFIQWLIREELDQNDISYLTGDIILQFFYYLIEERKVHGRTIQKYEVNLRQYFNFLIKNEKIKENPMPEIPKVPNGVDCGAKPIREDDLLLLKNFIIKNDPQLWLAIQFEFYCFIRPGTELRLMKLSWIDFYAGTITIPGFIEKDGEIIGIAKNRQTQTILIPKQFLNVLIKEYYLDKYDQNLYVIGNERKPGETPLGKNTLRTRFNRFRDALNLSKDYKFYSWKHTGGIKATRAGIPIKDIQNQMRHHSLEQTDKYLRKMVGVESEHIKNNYPML